MNLCATCAVKHDTDNYVRIVDCSKMGRHSLPVGVCSKHTKTREKLLEDALLELFEALEDPRVNVTSVHRPAADRVLVALLNAKALLGK